MPTEEKRQAVAELAELIQRSTIAIATSPSGMKVNEITALRRLLQEQGIDYKVVKNRLALIAADEAGMEPFRDLLEGPTAIVFGYGEPVTAAKALDEFIKQRRSQMVVRKAVMDGSLLTEAQVTALASLPPREEIIARLLGQMNAPITGLVTVLGGPLRGLATVLQRRAEQLEQ